MKIEIKFQLDVESDADIVAYFETLSDVARSMHIRQAIRDHIAIERNNTTLKELYNRVEHLIMRLECKEKENTPILFSAPDNDSIRNVNLVDDKHELDEIFGNIDRIGD